MRELTEYMQKQIHKGNMFEMLHSAGIKRVNTSVRVSTCVRDEYEWKNLKSTSFSE